MTVTHWNSADKTSGIVLSSGDTVANITTTDSSHQGVRADVSHDSSAGGKFMIGFRDVQLNGTGSPDPFDWVGLLLANVDDITLTRANGSFIEVILYANGHTTSGSSTHADGGGTSLETSDFSSLTLCDVDLAVDFDNMKYWFRVSNQNGNAWQNSGNPATNTGGRAINSGGVFYPATRLTYSSATTQNCRIEPVPTGLPSGFSTWGTPLTGMYITEAPDTFASIGYPGYPGTNGFLNTTEAPDVLAVAGYQPIGARLTVSEAKDVFSAYMTQPLTGTLAITEHSDAFHGTGIGLGEDGVFVTTEAPDIFAATMTTPIAGALNATETPDQFRAIGAGVTITRKRRIFFVS